MVDKIQGYSGTIYDNQYLNQKSVKNKFDRNGYIPGSEIPIIPKTPQASFIKMREQKKQFQKLQTDISINQKTFRKE